ncbi:MAG: DUF3501 family protein [Gammaproteobacteria bacterium]|nr:DUF3501 family protein [Gammaproteobacteria bacterium]
MVHLAREELYSLETYAQERTTFRARVLAAKKQRAVMLGEHVRLLFENRLTIQYQVQEMLRIEKIFEAAGIEEELEAYNPLIPDGDNWKATMLIQYEDVSERREKLRELLGIENRIWVCVGDHEKVFAIADEDLERADGSKTSAVHFLRFQLPADFINKVKNGEPLSIGVDHPQYRHTIEPIGEKTRASLAADLS